MTTISWSSFLSNLTSSKQARKCNLRLLDTIIVDGTDRVELKWYYTTKNGCIAKKKNETVSIQGIQDRFSKFALANPANDNKYVAVTIDGGSKTNYNLSDFSIFLDSMKARQDLGTGINDIILQVYLRPHQGTDSIYVAEYNRDNSCGLNGARKVFIRCNEGPVRMLEENLSLKHSVNDITKQIDFMTDEVVKCVQATTSKVVSHLVIEFLLDDNVHIWLSRITRLECCDEAQLTQIDTEPKIQSDDRILSSSDQEAGRTSSRSSLRSRSHSIGGYRASSREEGVRATNSIGRGELFIREGKKLSAALGPDELPGLRAWTLTATAAGGELIWRASMDQYLSSTDPDKAAVALRKERAQAKHTVSQSSVPLRLLLLRDAEDVLLGHRSFARDAEFADCWRLLLRTVLGTPQDASRSAADVIVCGNTFVIMRKLESLIECGFDAPDPALGGIPTEAVPEGALPGGGATEMIRILERPMSDPVLNRSHGHTDPTLRRGASAGGPPVQTDIAVEAPAVVSRFGSASSRNRHRLRAITPTIDEHSEDYADDDEDRGDTGALVAVSSTAEMSADTVAEADGNGAQDDNVDDVSDSDFAVNVRNGRSNGADAAGSKQRSAKPIPRNIAVKVGRKIESVYGKDALKRPKKGSSKGPGKALSTGEKGSSNHAEVSEQEAFARMLAHFSAEKERFHGELDQLRSQPLKRALEPPTLPEEATTRRREGRGHGKGKTVREIPPNTISDSSPSKHAGTRFKPGNSFSEALVDVGSMSTMSTGASGFGFATPVADVWSGPAPVMRSVVSRSSVLSASEQQFMHRNGQQLQTGVSSNGFDPVQEGPIGGYMHTERYTQEVNSSQSPTKPRNGITQDKSQREAALEKEVEKLTRKLAQREDELGRTEDLYKRRGRELEALRQSSQEDLRKLNENHSKELLMLRETHARQLASATTGTQPVPASRPTGKSQEKLADSSGQPVGESDGSKHWLAQLDAARSDFRKQQENFAAERRQMQSEFASRLEARDRQARSEAASLRAECSALEDRLVAVGEELAGASSKSEGLLKLCRQTEQARLEAVELANKLRSDLRGVQQAVTSTYRLEASQAIPAPSDPDAVVRAAEAKFAAKEKQMDNKMEFMKAQLAAEQATVEDLRATVKGQADRIEELKDEFRQRAREAEQSKAAAVEDTERRLEMQFEGRMSELTVLQAKVSLLQGQVSDAYQDGTLSKQREEAARSQLGRVTAQLAAMRAESEGLRTQVEELRQQRDELSQRHASQQNQEAVLRRLDNERQYLKSQLATELAHKTDLQKELAQCQAILVDTQRQWKADVDTLRANATSDTQTAAMHEQSLTEMNVQLEAECSRLRVANKELKDGFAKTRDLLRMEQLSLENLRADYDRLQDELRTSRDETVRVQEDERGISEMRQREISALAQSLEELEARRVRDVARMKEELAKQFLQQSSLQKDALKLHSSAEGERKLAGRRLGTTLILQSVLRWRRGRLFSHFRTWSSAVLLMNAADQFRDTMKKQLKRGSDEAAAERQHALEALRSLNRNELEVKMAEGRAEAASDLKRALDEADERHAAALARQETELEANFAHKELEWEEAIQQAQRQGEQAVAREVVLAQLREEEAVRRHQADLEALVEARDRQELVAREEAAREAEAGWLAKIRALEVDLDFKHTAQLANFEEEHKKQLEYAAQKTLRRLTERDETAAARLQEAHLEWQLKQAKEMETLEKTLAERFAAKEEAYRAEQAEAMAATRQQAHEESEERVRELRTVWKEELDDVIAAKGAEIKQGFEDRLLEAERAAESERQRAVRLEAQKWQQAAKEVQRRMELDLKLATTKGWEERDAAANEDISRLTQQHALELKAVADMHCIELEALQKSNAAEMEHLRNQLEAEHEEACRVAVAETVDRKDREWGEVLRAGVTKAEEEARLSFDARMKQNQAQLDKFRDDVVRQAQHHAQERQELLDRVARQEDLAKRMESLNATEIDQIRRECETDKEKLRMKCDKLKDRALAEMKLQYDNEKASAEARWREESAALVERERAVVQADAEVQMAQLQDESERLVTKLETAVGALRQEKKALTAALEDAKAKQEAAEVQKLELEESRKWIKQQHSLDLWRLSSSGAKLKVKYTTSLQGLRTAAEADTRRAVAAGEARIVELEMASLRFAEIASDCDKSRRRALTILTSHKTDVLQDKRTQTRVCEREMTRLSEEREALEQQKDRLEEEVDELQGQVQEVEEQIREHHRTSAVQNGRINVSFARKKRRLDNELERIFDLIEQKREAASKVDELIADRTRERDEKEAELVDTERALVEVLVEQQRMVLAQVDDNGTQVDERMRLVARIAGVDLPGPGSADEGGLARDLPALRMEAQDADMRRKAARI